MTREPIAWCYDCEKLRAENERLRDANKLAKDVITQLTGSKAALQSENESRRVQWEAAKREAATEIKRLTLLHDISERQAHLEIERLKEERHITKQMLQDILVKYGLARSQP